MYFFALFFVLLSKIIHEADHFYQIFSNSFSELFLFYFWQRFFSFFTCISVNFTFILLYSAIYIIHRNFVVPLQNSSIVFFYFSRIIYSPIFMLFSPPWTPWNTICLIALGSVSKAFCLLKQLKLVCNYLWKTHNLTNTLMYEHHLALLILFLINRTVVSSH